MCQFQNSDSTKGVISLGKIGLEKAGERVEDRGERWDMGERKEDSGGAWIGGKRIRKA
jgi:hypothetical protein